VNVQRVRRASFLVFVAGLLLSTSTGGHAADAVTLTWDANSEPDLAGYAVYYRIEQSGPPYYLIQDVPFEDLVDPKSPEVIVTGLNENKRYHFVVTAYDDENLESSFSNEVCVEAGVSLVKDCTPTAISTSNSGRGGGGGCFISSAAFESKLSLIPANIYHRSPPRSLRIGLKPAALNP
jgi:Fibronectin type III domain